MQSFFSSPTPSFLLLSLSSSFWLFFSPSILLSYITFQQLYITEIKFLFLLNNLKDCQNILVSFTYLIFKVVIMSHFTFVVGVVVDGIPGDPPC